MSRHDDAPASSSSSSSAQGTDGMGVLHSSNNILAPTPERVSDAFPVAARAPTVGKQWRGPIGPVPRHWCRRHEHAPGRQQRNRGREL